MTPMFQQYHELKAQHPDAVLFFRMGDFYECFFEDAEICSRVLDLTLTARNKAEDKPVPMAGVPHHAAGGYIQRLVEAGYRVAIGEQVEDASKAKGLVKRAVVRVVTPGVVLDSSKLAAREANYLVGVSRGARRRGWGLAFLDVSTGDLKLTSVAAREQVVAELLRLEPREALLGPGVDDDETILAALERQRTLLSDVLPEAWEMSEAHRELTEMLGVADLNGFGVRPKEAGITAAGAVVRYARERMGGEPLANVHRLQVWRPGGFMVVDDTTRRNLELTRTLLGARRQGSLVGLLDKTGSAMGSRMLREWMAFPLMDLDELRRRQRAVAVLLEEVEVRAALLEGLDQVADVERIVARVTQGTAHARDLAGLRRSLLAIPEGLAWAARVPGLDAWIPDDRCEDVAADLDRWLVEAPPISLTEGGLLQRGVHDELDEILELALEGRSIIAGVEAREREATGIPSLKIRHNKVFGYYLEVTRAHLHKVPEHYLRKQTLTNAERYITPELKELEEKVLGADERRKSLEYALFVELRDRVAAAGARLSALARSLASLDVLATFAELADRHRWCRPELTDELELVLEGARHPVVEATMGAGEFVPNDVRLDAERQLIVLTGPNMSGKSTTMRQVAILVLLAQMGSWVPADRARVGLCDRIFTRVGAADDLSRGQSTFMVEMAETASILHNATDKSLVVLDEIGRGTSTYDGLSIAWAVAEDLVDRVGCRGLFATHYHELCELAETRSAVVNQSVAVSESGDKIVFLRRLQDGGASRSYGIQCARIAGLPRGTVRRARQLLKHFEKQAPRNDRQQLSLFGDFRVPEAAVEEVRSDPLRELLEGTDPDALSPREAHDLVYRLKGLL
jgi:DNA mismatch repair protein MutS